MIVQISGKVIRQNPNSLFIDIAGICYEVLVPTAIIHKIEKSLGDDGIITLATYHYHNVEPSKSIPILIGFLKSLPGIGQQRAKEIVAKLQGKVVKYGLIQDEDFVVKEAETSRDIALEAVEVLVQLQYKRQEAKEMVHKALERAPHSVTTEALLNEVYKHKVKK